MTVISGGWIIRAVLLGTAVGVFGLPIGFFLASLNSLTDPLIGLFFITATGDDL